VSDDFFDPFDMVLSEPAGSFKYFHSEGKDGHIQQSLNNKNEIAKRIDHARESNCLIELISLRLQFIEMWLRVYYNNVPHKESRQQEFGRFIRQCFDAGLDKKIYDKLVKFNKDRRTAIHGYLLGEMKYDDFSVTVADSDGLAEEIIRFVILNSGETITAELRAIPSKVGDLILDVRHALSLSDSASKI